MKYISENFWLIYDWKLVRFYDNMKWFYVDFDYGNLEIKNCNEVKCEKIVM